MRWQIQERMRATIYAFTGVNFSPLEVWLDVEAPASTAEHERLFGCPVIFETEESGIFVNTEGRPQMAARAGFPPGAAKENWAILRALSAELGHTLPFDSLSELRSGMFEIAPHLERIDEVPDNEWQALPVETLAGGTFASPITDHYQTNPIARASTVMAELSKLAAGRQDMAAE